MLEDAQIQQRYKIVSCGHIGGTGMAVALTLCGPSREASPFEYIVKPLQTQYPL